MRTWSCVVAKQLDLSIYLCPQCQKCENSEKIRGPPGDHQGPSTTFSGPLHVKNVKILKTIFGPQGPQEVKNVKISEIGRYPQVGLDQFNQARGPKNGEKCKTPLVGNNHKSQERKERKRMGSQEEKNGIAKEKETER